MVSQSPSVSVDACRFQHKLEFSRPYLDLENVSRVKSKNNSFHNLFSVVLFYLILFALIPPSYSLQTNFHTRSPYLIGSLNDVEDKLYKIPGLFKDRECFAVQSSVVLRNGIAFPSEKLIREIINIHGKLVEAMDLDINSKLYNWNNPFPIDKADLLSKRGKHEQHLLGRKTALKLLSLFGSEDIGDVTFLTSSEKAPKESSQSFYGGFFDGLHGSESDEDEDGAFDTEVDEKLLKFYDRCQSQKKKTSEEISNEFSKFLMSEHMDEIQSKITRMLDIGKDNLTPENVWHIYQMCGFEQANFDSSPWCSLLDEEDLVVLEYLGDLKLYHDVGYGTKKPWSHGCHILSEMFTAMEEAIDEIEGLDINEEAEGYTVGLFGFGQEETIATFMSTLGLFNDSLPLTADNFESLEQRNFHGGRNIPFSANVHLILYECAPEDYRKAETNYFVKLFVNEKPVLIPGCPDLHCSFQKVTNHYQYLTDDCHSKKFCSHKPLRDEL